MRNLLLVALIAALSPLALRGQDAEPTPPAPPAAAEQGARPVPPPPTEVRLLVRADDMGVAQAMNEGCLQAFQEGIARSAELIVPGPWFLDAVRLLKENPTLDVGVHLTLTSEWDRMKWRPLTNAPSLVDADGYFHATTAAFTQTFKLDEVEHELRSQIEVAQRHLGPGRVTHVSAHMGAATATPELKALTDKLAKEYKLRPGDGGGTLQRAGSFGNATFSSDQRERALLAVLDKLQPGDWLLVEHPAYDTGETLRLGHKGYENVGADRSNVRRALTSRRVLELVRRRGIKLIGYGDLKE